MSNSVGTATSVIDVMKDNAISRRLYEGLNGGSTCQLSVKSVDFCPWLSVSLRPRPNASGEFDSEIQIFSNPFSRVEKNKSATNPRTCGLVNPDIFESGDVANSYPVSCQTINQYGGRKATKGQILRKQLHHIDFDHVKLLIFHT